MCFPCFGRFMGNYIVILYLIVKFIYVVNTVFQVYLISGLLGKDFWLYGFHFMYNLFQGHGWTISSSKYFPSKFKVLNSLSDWNFDILLKRGHAVRFYDQVNLFSLQKYSNLFLIALKSKREVGNPNTSHRYTVQCVLPINLFNQQIFTVFNCEIFFNFISLSLSNSKRWFGSG